MTGKRVYIAGNIRWALTEDRRIIVQFATLADRDAAFRLWAQNPTLGYSSADDPTVEFNLPESKESK